MPQKIKQDDTILIGDNIRNIRKELGLTQEDVVRELQLAGFSISRGTYAKIEMGTRSIPASQLEAIKEILHTDYDTLFRHTEKGDI